MLRKLCLILLLPLLSTSCLHSSFRFSGEFQTADGTKSGRFTSIQTTHQYPTAVGCALTFWIYGGACWLYLAMPFSGDKIAVRERTEFALQKEFGQPVFIPPSPIEQYAWVRVPESSTYVLNNAGAPAAAPAATQNSPLATIDIPRPALAEIQARSPFKIFLANLAGVGFAYEWQLPQKISLEGGAGIGVNRTRAILLQLKHAVALNQQESLKLGLVAVQMEQVRHRAGKPGKEHYLVERSPGVLLEVESQNIPSFQLIYFYDKPKHEIQDVLFNLTYRLRY